MNESSAHEIRPAVWLQLPYGTTDSIPFQSIESSAAAITDVDYDLGAFRGNGSMRQFLGMRMAGAGRDWRSGIAWTRSQKLQFGFEATRCEAPTEAPVHEIEGRTALRW